MFLGKVNERWSDLPDMSIREIGFMAPLAIIVLLLGVYPRPALDIMVATMDHLIDLVNLATQVAGF
jgi:NADH:ubiquinone oxidoreductase subunit 4 (subunit M)